MRMSNVPSENNTKILQNTFTARVEQNGCQAIFLPPRIQMTLSTLLWNETDRISVDGC
jgi:hypothetical protein